MVAVMRRERKCGVSARNPLAPKSCGQRRDQLSTSLHAPSSASTKVCILPRSAHKLTLALPSILQIATMMSMVELFSFLGFPARVAGRALLVFRYVSNRGSTARLTTDYAEKRFGENVRLRPWLTIDVIELEEIDELLNQGSDAQVESWRVNQLSVCGMIAIIVGNSSSVYLSFPLFPLPTQTCLLSASQDLFSKST